MDELALDDGAFQELLPFYVNGTLDPSRRQQMEQYLETHPEAELDLAFLCAARTSMLAEASRMDPLEGYAQFKRQLDLAPPHGSRSPGLAHRWAAARDRFRSWGLSPAVAALLVIVVAQLAVTVNRSDIEREGAGAGSTMRGAPQAGRTADLKILVKAGVPFDTVTALLLENNCKITWGPSQQSEYWLVLDQPGKSAAVAERLMASHLLDNVQLLAPN